MFTRISASVDAPLLFIDMIPIECKIKRFSLHLFFCFYKQISDKYNIGELTSATSNERMTTDIIFAGATPIN